MTLTLKILPKVKILETYQSRKTFVAHAFLQCWVKLEFRIHQLDNCSFFMGSLVGYRSVAVTEKKTVNLLTAFFNLLTAFFNLLMAFDGD